MAQFLDNMKPVNRNNSDFKAAGMSASVVEQAANKDIFETSIEIKTTLNSFFLSLKSVNAEFGYRCATEIFRFINQSLINDDTDDKLSLDDILDCIIVQKLLPKLHGSRKKLEPVLQTLLSR